jgi:hypothetical protein
MLYRNYLSFMKTQNNFEKIQSNTFKYTCIVEHINELLFEAWSLPGLSFLTLTSCDGRTITMVEIGMVFVYFTVFEK